MKKGHDYTGVTVVFFCHDGNGKVLCALRNENCRDEFGRWDPGGGGVDFGEKIELTIAREIEEEYGAVPIEVEFLGFRDVHREHQGEQTHWVALDHKVLIDPSIVVNREPHKHDELRWFTRDELLAKTNLHSQFPKFLNDYHERLW